MQLQAVETECTRDLTWQVPPPPVSVAADARAATGRDRDGTTVRDRCHSNTTRERAPAKPKIVG